MNEVRLNTRIIASLKKEKLLPTGEMIKSTVKNKSTWYRVMDHPDEITVQQLIALSNGLHIPVRRFFLTGGKEDAVRSCRDCVVGDGYLPCSYDAAALQSIVESRPDATWQKAADATGMSRDNLKNSLLAVRRTPVSRFLEACQALSIDPFTILLDPNPEPKKGRRASSGGANEALRAEVRQMHSDIDALNQTVADLQQKYEALLKDYEQLAQRLQVNIDTISGSYIGNIGLAADSIAPQKPGK